MEEEEKKPNCKIQYSSKTKRIRIYSDLPLRVDGKNLPPVNRDDLSLGYERILNATPSAFVGVSMLAEQIKRDANVEITKAFSEARNDYMFTHDFDEVTGGMLWQWNAEYSLKPAQAALAAKIIAQLKNADITAVDDIRPGAGFYNISKPGTGKTPTSIAVAMGINARRVLVVAPTALLGQWVSEVEKFFDPAFVPGIVLIPKGTNQTERKDAIDVFTKTPSCWGFIGYETLRIEALSLMNTCTPYDLIICDESVIFINPENETSRAAEMLFRGAKNILQLSGTPIKNHGGELHNNLLLSRVPYAMMMDRETFRDRHADAITMMIPDVGPRKKWVGIKEIMALAEGASGQYSGLPQDKSLLPAENYININIPMSEEAENRYRAIEMGYSTTPGMSAVEAYAAKPQMQAISHAFDEHRGVQVSSLSGYLDLINDTAKKEFGLEAQNDTDEETSVGEVFANEEDESESLRERIAEIRGRLDAIDGEVAVIKAERDALEEVRVAIVAEINRLSKLETRTDTEELELQKHQEQRELVATRRASLADEGRKKRAEQKTIREEELAPMEARLRELRVSAQQKAQARANTFIRMRRAGCLSEWVITEDGGRELRSVPSPKVEWIVDFVQSNPAEKILIFSALTSAVRDIITSLESAGIKVATIRDGMKSEEVEAVKRSYMTGDVNVMVLSCKRGVGHNLQVTTQVIFESTELTPDLFEQNVARAVRMFSTTDTVNIYRLFLTFADGTPTADGYVKDLLDTKTQATSVFAASNVQLKLHVPKSEDQVLREMEDTLRSV